MNVYESQVDGLCRYLKGDNWFGNKAILTKVKNHDGIATYQFRKVHWYNFGERLLSWWYNRNDHRQKAILNALKAIETDFGTFNSKLKIKITENLIEPRQQIDFKRLREGEADFKGDSSVVMETPPACRAEEPTTASSEELGAKVMSSLNYDEMLHVIEDLNRKEGARGTEAEAEKLRDRLQGILRGVDLAEQAFLDKLLKDPNRVAICQGFTNQESAKLIENIIANAVWDVLRTEQKHYRLGDRKPIELRLHEPLKNLAMELYPELADLGEKMKQWKKA